MGTTLSNLLIIQTATAINNDSPLYIIIHPFGYAKKKWSIADAKDTYAMCTQYIKDWIAFPNHTIQTIRIRQKQQ